MSEILGGFFSFIGKGIEAVTTSNYTPQQQYVYEKTKYNPLYGAVVAGQVNKPQVSLKTNFIAPPKEVSMILVQKGRRHITQLPWYEQAYRERKQWNYNQPTTPHLQPERYKVRREKVLVTINGDAISSRDPGRQPRKVGVYERLDKQRRL